MKLRGVTLIEVFVAMTISAIVLTAAMAIYSVAVKNTRLATIKSELERDGTYLQELLERDLRSTGLGFPRGLHLTDGYAGAGPTSLYGAVILAIPSAVGVVADLPALHASYNTFGMLSTLVEGPPGSFSEGDQHIFWHTENNGGCQPLTSGAGPGCTTGETSVFFPGLDGCNDDTNDFDRTCPWGLRRLVSGQRFQVVFGDGTWVTAPGNIELHEIHNHAWLFLNAVIHAQWEVTNPARLPATAPSQGFVTTLDRVFYYQDGSRLRRVQCEGDPDSGDADWPAATAAAMPATPQNVANNTCNNADPDIIARNVDTVTFSYFDGAGAAITNIDTAAEKNAVRSIGYFVRLKKALADTDGATDVVHEISGRVGLRNL